MSQIIFIVGYSRSGTKMLNSILSAMGICDSVPEVHFFEQFYEFSQPREALEDPLDRGEAENIANRLVDVVARIGARLHNGRPVNEVRAALIEFVGSRESVSRLQIYRRLLSEMSLGLPVDPTPRNAYYISELAELFSESQFIYMVRDPRDCVLSQKKKWATYLSGKNRPFEAMRLWLNYNPLLMARFWKNSIAHHALAQSRGLGERLLCIRYEDVTQNPRAVGERLAAFLHQGKLDFDDSFIRRDNSRKWARSLPASHVCLIQWVVGGSLREHGYDPAPVPLPSRVVALLLVPWYLLKLPLAVLVNMSRIRSPINTIRRRLLPSHAGS